MCQTFPVVTAFLDLMLRDHEEGEGANLQFRCRQSRFEDEGEGKERGEAERRGGAVAGCCAREGEA